MAAVRPAYLPSSLSLTMLDDFPRFVPGGQNPSNVFVLCQITTFTFTYSKGAKREVFRVACRQRFRPRGGRRFSDVSPQLRRRGKSSTCLELVCLRGV